MILDTLSRADLFGKARALNPSLGAVFQNPIEVTPEMILEEINHVRRLRDQEHERFSNYLVSLRQVRMEIENAYRIPAVDPATPSAGQSDHPLPLR